MRRYSYKTEGKTSVKNNKKKLHTFGTHKNNISLKIFIKFNY